MRTVSWAHGFKLVGGGLRLYSETGNLRSFIEQQRLLGEVFDEISTQY